MKTTVIVLALAGVTCSCAASNFDKKEIFTPHFSITVPDKMMEVDHLNVDATLQLQSIHDELYLTVVEEPKSYYDNLPRVGQFAYLPYGLEGYIIYHLKAYDLLIDNLQIQSVKDVKINLLPAQILSANRIEAGFEVFYKIAFIKGDENYYRIEVFTLMDFKEKHEYDMVQIINSFTDR